MNRTEDEKRRSICILQFPGVSTSLHFTTYSNKPRFYCERRRDEGVQTACTGWTPGSGAYSTNFPLPTFFCQWGCVTGSHRDDDDLRWAKDKQTIYYACTAHWWHWICGLPSRNAPSCGMRDDPNHQDRSSNIPRGLGLPQYLQKVVSYEGGAARGV